MRDGENEQDVVPAFMELTIWRGNKHRHMLIEQCSQYNDRDVHWVYHRQACSSDQGAGKTRKESLEEVILELSVKVGAS